MTEKELQNKLEEIRKDMKLLDSIVYTDFNTGKGELTEKQVKIVKKLFSIFQDLNWQLSFNNYKELVYDDSKPPINKRECGTLVKVRPCKEEYGDKTYVGYLLGNIPLSVNFSIDDNVVSAKRSFYNPAIFVPELKDIVYGCESWWSRIEDVSELEEISDNDINNVWYVQALKKLENNKNE